MTNTISTPKFIATQETKTHIKKRVIVAVNPEIKEENIKNLVADILENEKENPDLVSLTITEHSKKKVTYTYVDREGEVKEKTITAKKHKIIAKISLSVWNPATFTPVRESWKACLTRIKINWKNEHPEKGSFTTFLWTHLILPFSAIRQRKIAELQKYQQAVGKGGSYAMMDTLDQAFSFLSAQEDPFKLEAKDMQTTGRQIIRALESGEPAQSVAQSITEEIVNRFRAHGEVPRDLLTVPVGYYTQDGYQYVLLSFSKDKKDNLCLRKYSTDPEARENRESAELFYTFDSPIKGKLTSLLSSFISCQSLAEPSTSLSKKEQKKEDALKHYFDLLNIPVENPEGTAILSSDLERLIVGSGGILHHGEQKAIGAPKRNPWSLVSHWMRMDSSNKTTSEAATDKMLWLLHMAKHHLEVSLASIEKLSEKEKRQLLPELKQELDAIKRAINKEFGQEEAFSLLVQQDEFFQDLSDKIQDLEEHLEHTQELEAAKQLSQAEKALKTPALKTIKMEFVEQEKLSPSGEAKVAITESFTIHALQKDFKTFSEAIESQDHEKAYELFSQFVETLNGLMDAGDYSQALSLSTHLMQLVPVPIKLDTDEIEENKDFWHTLFLKDFDPAVDPKEKLSTLDNWGSQVSMVTECMWEAHLRLNQTHPWPEERDSLICARCILLHVARSKEWLIQQKMKARLQEMNPEKRKELLQEVFPGCFKPVESTFDQLKFIFRQNFFKIYHPKRMEEFLQEVGINLSLEELTSGEGERIIKFLYLRTSPEDQLAALCRRQKGDSFPMRLDDTKDWNLDTWGQLVEWLPDVSRHPVEVLKANANLPNYAGSPSLEEFFNRIKDNPKAKLLEILEEELQRDPPSPDLENYKELIFHFIKESYRYLPPVNTWDEKDFEEYITPILKSPPLLNKLVNPETYGEEEDLEESNERLTIEEFREKFEERKEEAKKIKEALAQLSAEIKESPEFVGQIIEMALINKTLDYKDLNSRRFGHLCAQCGVSEEEASELAFLNFWTDAPQMRDYIHFDPYLLSFNAEAHQRQKECMEFLSGIEDLYVSTSIRLDQWNSDKPLEKDQKYLQALFEIRQGFHQKEKEPSNREFEEMFRSFDSDVLPSTIVNLRKNRAQWQCAIQDNCLFLSFPANLNGRREAIDWYVKKMELTKDELDPEKRQEKILELQQADLLKRITQMKGRIQFEVGDYVLGGEPVIKIVPKDKSQSTPDAREGIAYRPQGHGLEGLGVPNFENPENAKTAIGQIPVDLAFKVLEPTPSSQKSQHGIKNRFNENTERGLLSEAFEQSSAQSPFERYALATLNSAKIPRSLRPDAEENSVVESLDFIFNYPERLEEESTQRLLLMSLFSYQHLQQAVSNNPRMFIERSDAFKQLIQTSLENGNIKTAVFLMHIGSCIQDFAEEPFEFPGYETEYTWKIKDKEETKEGVQILKDELAHPSSAQKYLSTYSLDAFLKMYPDPKEAFKELSAHEIATYLLAYAQLKNDGSDSGIALMQKNILEKMVYSYIPALLDEDKAIVDEILDAYLLQAIPGSLPEESWEKEEGSLTRFSNGPYTIDIQAGLIKSEKDEGKVEGSLSLLPPEVTSHPIYIQAFKEQKFLARVSPGNSSQEFIYSFQIPRKKGKMEVKIVYNRQLKSMQITSDELPKDLIPSNEETFTFTLLKGQQLKNAQKLLQRYGVWLDKNNEKGFSIWNSPSKATALDLFSLHPSKKKGEWILVKEPDAYTQGQPLVVCQDTEGTYSQWLKFVDPTNLLFLRSENSSTITQFRILDKGLVFDKQPDGSWICQTDAYKGYVWNPGKLSENGASFGKSLRNIAADCMLPLSKEGKADRFLIWPHTIASTSSNAVGIRQVEFRKKDDLEFEKTRPVLEVRVDSEGTVESSCAGFLHLSLLFQAKGDAKRAHYYLEKAIKTRLLSNQKEIFQDIALMIHQRPYRSARDAAYKLKAELAISRIQRQQLGTSFYDPQNPQRFFAYVTFLSSLHNDYQKKVEEAATKRPETLLEEELLLTDEEEEEYQKIRLESLQFLTQTAPEFLVAAPKPIAFKVPLSLDESPGFFKDALIKMAKPGKSPPDDLKAFQSLKEDNFLPYFFHYANQIQENGWTKEDLISLMRAPIHADGQKAQSIAFARNLLLSIALLNELEGEDNPIQNVPLFHLKELYKLKTSLPSSITKRTGFIRKFISDKKILDTQVAHEQFEASFEKIFNYLKNQKITNEMLTLPTQASQLLPEEKELQKEMTSKIEELKEFLTSEECPLSPQEKAQVQIAIQAIQEKEIESVLEANHTLNQLVKLLSGYGVNLLEIRREAVLKQRIEEGEKKIEAEEEVALQFANPTLSLDQLNEVANKFGDEFEDLFTLGPAVVLDDEKAMSYFADSKKISSMEKASNKKHREGIEKAAEKLRKELDKRKDLAEDADLEILISAQEDLAAKIATRKEGLLDWAKSKEAPSRLKAMSRNADLYGETEILAELLQLYQKGMVRSSPDENEDAQIVRDITEFLCIATAHQQYGEALKKLQTGLTLQGEARIQEISKGYALLEAGSATTRYLNRSNSKLNNPQIDRKKLVVEFNSGKILTDEQHEMIDSFMKEPNSVKTLRMGKGKTSMIMPIMLNLFAEQGMLAIGIITEELITQHWAELDENTRTLLRQPGVIFHLPPDILMPPAYYAEQYHKFITARNEKEYRVTTIQSINAVESHLKLIANRLVEIEDQMAKDPDKLDELTLEMRVLAQQEMWLVKIKGLFEADKETGNNALGFRTQFIADEYDAIFDIRLEINQALGSPKDLDSTLVKVGQNLMNAFMHDFKKDKTPLLNKEEQKLLEKIQKALRTNGQSGLTPKEREEGIKAFAKLLTHAAYKKKFGLKDIKIEENQIEEWVKYLTGDAKKEDAMIPDFLPDPVPSEVIDLKRFLAIPSGSLLQALEKNIGVDLGARKVDGAVPVPLQDKAELPNTNFSDPYEIVMNGLVLSLGGGATDAFYLRAIPLLQKKDPKLYRKIIKGGKGDPIAYIRNPKNWAIRLGIFKQAVLDEGYIKVPPKQAQANVQDVIRGKNCGAISGTESSFCLPEGFVKEEDSTPYEVEGETCLRIALGLPEEGLEAPCTERKESEMLELAHQRIKEDPAINTVIVTGVGFGGKKTNEIIKEMREENPDRQFVYIDSDTRKKTMWNPEEEDPISFDPERVDSTKCIFFFDPADKRGTDFNIPAGKCLLFVGPSTLEPQFNQAIWRRRNAGIETQFEPVITPSVAQRIRKNRKLKKNAVLEFGHLISDISVKTAHENGPLNFKQELVRINGKTRHTFEQLRFSPQEHKFSDEYWIPDDEHTATLMADVFFDNMIFRLGEKLMIKDKTLVRSSGASYQQDSVERLIEVCQEAIDAIQEQGGYRSQLGQQKEAFLLKYVALHAKPGMSQKEINQLRNEGKAIYESRFQKANDTLKQLAKDLVALKQEYEDKAEELKQLLPDHVAHLTSTSLHTMEQAQEMQQTQMQQKQVETETKGKVSLTATPSFEYAPFNEYRLMKSKESKMLAGTSKEKVLRAFDDTSQVYITPEVKNILDFVSDDPKGHPLFRIAIVQPEEGANTRVCLLSKNDYYHCMRSMGFWEKNEDSEYPKIAIYSFDTASEEKLKERYGEENPVGLYFVQSNEPSPDLTDPRLVKQVAIAKLRAGFSNYTHAEREALQIWLSKRDDNEELVSFAKEKGVYI